MNKKGLSEADIKAKFITPAILKSGMQRKLNHRKQEKLFIQPDGNPSKIEIIPSSPTTFYFETKLWIGKYF